MAVGLSRLRESVSVSADGIVLEKTRQGGWSEELKSTPTGTLMSSQGLCNGSWDCYIGLQSEIFDEQITIKLNNLKSYRINIAKLSPFFSA